MRVGEPNQTSLRWATPRCRNVATLATPSVQREILTSSGEVDLARQLAEARAAVLGDLHDLLEADPELPRQVDPGLDRVDHPRLQHDVRPRHHVRRLVAGEPETVAGAVHEELAEAGGGDDLPGRGVDLAAR